MIAIYCLCFLSLIYQLYALNNGVGIKPAMGYNVWNAVHCDVNETFFKAQADLLVKLGLKDLGYNYANLDDCWQVGRDNITNKIIVDSTKFPSGIASLVTYINKLGLKMGIYSDAGVNTCAGRPGSLNYEVIDAQTYADWGIEYLKYE